VFHHAGKSAAVEPKKQVRLTMPIDGQWPVSFEPDRGAPAGTFALEYLQSLSEIGHPGIRYFSGIATYRKVFPFNDWLGVNLADGTRIGLGDFKQGAKRYLLDLGEVEVTAEVWLNGKPCGVVWKRPYVVDITDAIDASPTAVSNELVVKVATPWRNRLIGDHFEPDDCEWGLGNERAGNGVGRPLHRLPDFVLKGTPRPSSGRITFATWDYFGINSPLVPSGLIGPIRLTAEK